MLAPHPYGSSIVLGRRTSVTDQNGKVTSYAFDDADCLTSVTDAAQHVTIS
jgi:YD repeat-containing protein